MKDEGSKNPKQSTWKLYAMRKFLVLHRNTKIAETNEQEEGMRKCQQKWNNFIHNSHNLPLLIASTSLAQPISNTIR